MAEHTTAAPWALPYPDPNGKVKLGATNFKELAERLTTLFKERFLTVTEHAANFGAVSGELVKCTGAITVTLPAAAANAIVGVIANGHEVKVGAGAALIYGDFIAGATPITLVGYQHVILESDGTNWFIIAGEPKREQVYGALTGRVAGTEYEPSTTRDAYVLLSWTSTGANARLQVGGVDVLSETALDSGGHGYIGFLVPAGVKWKGTEINGMQSTYLLR